MSECYVEDISDVAAMKNMSVVKSKKDGLIYIWGCLTNVQINNDDVVCEYTNIFDISNTMVGQLPIPRTDEDINILNDLINIFNDRVSLIHSVSYFSISLCSTIRILPSEN